MMLSRIGVRYSLMTAVVAMAISLYPEASMGASLQIPALTVDADGQQQSYSLSIQILLLMTALTFLPALLMITTSFTRIIIVLSILRQALGLNQTPSNQIMIGLALFLTLFIMAPTYEHIYEEAITPYLNESADLQTAWATASESIKSFMLAQTRETDLTLFTELAATSAPDDVKDVPLSVLVPAFITSELKTAFQIGFLIFVPFLIIDLVVASVLMAMGMMMLSPMMISLPFKIMLFVMIDGWTLTMGTLASSFF